MRSHMGINFPKNHLSLPPSPLKIRTICASRFGLEKGVDFIVLSYVRGARMSKRRGPCSRVWELTCPSSLCRSARDSSGLCLSWGVLPLLAPHFEDLDHMLRTVEVEAVKAGLLTSGERVVITAGTPIVTRGTTNLIKADVIV